MCSPMFDMPEHMMIPVDVNGDGPAEEKMIDHYVCWCGDKTCDKELVDLRAARNKFLKLRAAFTVDNIEWGPYSLCYAADNDVTGDEPGEMLSELLQSLARALNETAS